MTFHNFTDLSSEHLDFADDDQEDLSKLSNRDVTKLAIEHAYVKAELNQYHKFPLPYEIDGEDLKVVNNHGFSREDLCRFKIVIARALSEKDNLAQVSDAFLDFAEHT